MFHIGMEGELFLGGTRQTSRLLTLAMKAYPELSCPIISTLDHYFLGLVLESHLNRQERPKMMSPFQNCTVTCRKYSTG